MMDNWFAFDNWFAYIDKFVDGLGGINVYLTIGLKAVFAVIVAGIVWLVVKRILSVFQKRTRKYTFFQNNDKIFPIIRKALFYFLLLFFGTYLIRLFEIELLEKSFNAFIIVLLASPAADFLHLLLGYLQKNFTARGDTKIDDIVFDLLNKFAGAAIYAIAVILALDILGVNVMPFIAGAGVAGIAIGFAAKDTLSNLIAGVLLILDRPFEVGDRIEVWSAPTGSATWGDVIDIGLRATKIKTTDNIIIVIPNNEIMKRDIVNYTIISSKIRIRINIGVAYDADLKKAKEAILSVAKKAEWVAAEPPPKVVVRNFGESSVDLQLRVWITDARRRINVIDDITDAVKDAFDSQGIEIPYPKRDINIRYSDSIAPTDVPEKL
jgi:small-conductance mechanosensitive channel